MALKPAGAAARSLHAIPTSHSNASINRAERQISSRQRFTIPCMSDGRQPPSALAETKRLLRSGTYLAGQFPALL